MIDSEVKQHLVTVCTILNNHDVDYIVVGGAAVSHYGHNRPSGIGAIHQELKVDLDFWYNPLVSNYHKILAALDELNIDTSELKDLVFDKNKTFLKIPHKDFHTDFLPVMMGLNAYQASKTKSEIIEVGGIHIPILAYDDLIVNKRAVNRKTDQSDIENLDRAKASRKRGRGI